jgi:hypothetical protein
MSLPPQHSTRLDKLLVVAFISQVHLTGPPRSDRQARIKFPVLYPTGRMKFGYLGIWPFLGPGPESPAAAHGDMVSPIRVRAPHTRIHPSVRTIALAAVHTTADGVEKE